MYARPSAKLVPAKNLDDLVTDGAGFAGFAAGEIGQVHERSRHRRSPISPASRRSLGPTVARFACDITVDGEEWPYDPRTILRRQLTAAREQGFEFKMGLELEYFSSSSWTTAPSGWPTSSTRSRSLATTSTASQHATTS